MLNELGICCISNKKKFINVINNTNRLIFIDSDGTLKKTDGTISKRTKQAISKCQMQGDRIIVCTARPRYQTLDVMKEAGADNIVISSNGSEIFDSKNNKVIYNSFIDNGEVIKLVEYAYLMDIRLILAMDDYDYVTKTIRNSNQVLLDKDDYKEKLASCNVKQCMFIDKKYNEIAKMKKMVSSNKALSIVDEISESSSYDEKWFSVANSNSSKGNALNILVEYLNVPFDQTIAIGNDKNDISMFKMAGLSVAVENATDGVKKNADYITLSNDDDGVALFLEMIN